VSVPIPNSWRLRESEEGLENRAGVSLTVGGDGGGGKGSRGNCLEVVTHLTAS
jgi:hypothetical protein